MTWQELHARLREAYRPVQDLDSWVVIGWTFPGDPPMRQLVSVAAEVALDRPWLVIGADVGPAGAVTAAHALRRNAELALGAIAVVGDDCVVRFGVPMAHATWELVELAQRLVAAEAVRIRRVGVLPGATTALTEAFVGYAD